MTTAVAEPVRTLNAQDRCDRFYPRSLTLPGGTDTVLT